MAKETIKVLEIDTKPAETSIKDLRKQLKGFKDEMANLEEGSDAFLEVANKAGEVKHQLDEINESIKGASADFGDMIGNVTNVAAGITGAFQAVAGGLQAMGIESKAIDETIVRMQGLMAVTQGLSAIDDGVKSFDKLTKSLGKAGETLGVFVKGLGKIAAPVAIIYALGVAFDKLKQSIDGTNKALAEREQAQKQFNSELEKEIEIRKRAGFEEEEILVFEIAKLELRNKALEENNKLLQEQEEAAKEAAREEARLAQSMGSFTNSAEGAGFAIGTVLGVSKKYSKGIEENTKEINTNNESITKLKEQLDIIIRARELAATRTKEEKTEVENLTSAYKEFEKIDVPEWITGADLTPVEDLSNALNIVQSDADKTREKLLEIQKVGNEQFDILKNTTMLLSESSLGLSSSWVNSITDFQNVFNEVMDVVVAKGEVGWSSYAQIASASLQSIGTLLNNLSAEQDQNTIEGFKKQKELQIGATIMNTLSGIIAAWTSSMALPAPASFILGGIQTAATAALGAAQLAKIKEAKFGDNGNIAKPSTGGLSSIVMPATQYSQALQTSQLKDTVQDSRVYVVESDIKETGKKVEVIESENRY